jgi:hypothetical protein
MQYQKHSVTGLLSQGHEVTRFENLFYKAVGSAYYNLEWGLDWNLFLLQDFNISVDSFLSYVTQEATKRGIVIDKLDGGILDFRLQIDVTVEGLTTELSRVLRDAI